MAVITVSRELGSEGDVICDIICEKTGLTRMDKALLLKIAEEAGIDVEAVVEMERGFTKRARLVSGEMTSLYRKQASAFDGSRAMDDRTYAQVLHDTIQDYARQGDALIVGRGGQMVLRDWPGALHVRLYAPEEVRIQRLMARDNVSQANATRLVQQNDEQKRQFIRQMFNNADWRNPKYYHLTIDTARISRETAAELVVLAAQG
jgi:cytidylate kinase